MNTHGKNGQAIGHAYGKPMATPMARYGTVRNGTERHQDHGANPSVPNAARAVDNPKMVRFIELDDDGWSGRQIAKELGVNERTVSRWRALTGRVKREAPVTHPQSDHDIAAALIADGAPLHEAAAAVGVTYPTIRRWFPEAQAWTKSQAGQYGQMSRRLSAIQGKAA